LINCFDVFHLLILCYSIIIGLIIYFRKEIWGLIKPVVDWIWGGLKIGFEYIWYGIKFIWELLKNISAVILYYTTLPLRTVLNIIGGKMPRWLGGGKWGDGLFGALGIQAPRFEFGGIVTQETIGIIGEAGDNEAIIPLNDRAVGFFLKIFEKINLPTKKDTEELKQNLLSINANLSLLNNKMSIQPKNIFSFGNIQINAPETSDNNSSIIISKLNVIENSINQLKIPQNEVPESKDNNVIVNSDSNYEIAKFLATGLITRGDL
jgi:hypothetical protein